MIADLEPPKPLPPILPGYRPPFNSETGRAAGLKTQSNLRAERETYRKLGLDKLINRKRPRNLLLAVQKAIVRHANASAEANLPDCGTAHARNAKLFHDIFQSLQGFNPSLRNMAKRGHSKPHLAHVQPMAKVAPISTIQSTNPVSQDASQVKPEAINPAVSPVTPQTEPLPGQG